TQMTKQITKAAKLCRAAFAEYPKATHAWCCHHEKFFEELSEPAENRIQFILSAKAESEQVTRLNNFRPVTELAKFQQAWAEYGKVTQQAWAEYDKVTQQARAEYGKVTQQAWAELEKVTHQARAEYGKVTQPASKPLLKIYKQDVPLGTWNGKSI